MREQRSGVSFAGPAVHPNPKLEKIWGKARRGRGVHMELSSFRPITSNVEEDNKEDDAA